MPYLLTGSDNSDEFQKSSSLTIVAIDKDDKNSQLAVKWAMDHLLTNSNTLVLIHVMIKQNSVNQENAELTPDQMESAVNQLFLPYRGFCARKAITPKEVLLDDTDVAKAIIEFISVNPVHQIVVGASNRNAITRKFRNADVPTSLVKGVPDHCGVYVIHKGKPVTIRVSKGPVPAASKHHENPLREIEEIIRNKNPLAKKNWRNTAAPTSPEVAVDRSFEYQKDRPAVSGEAFLDIDNNGPVVRAVRTRNHEQRYSDSDFEGSIDFQSGDFGDAFEFVSVGGDSPPNGGSGANGDVEAENRRLKLELKQTMEMYNAACKEAIEAKKKAKELQRWKLEEMKKMEELRQAAESALALVEVERVKCKAAMEKAEAAQMLAEKARAKCESEDRMKAADSLADLRYRRYSIDDIEVATNFFAKNMKLGEGGYGPVYKASLDHTPVAIKVLRPDAAQGRQQFQQEVEILSSIRHPNLVLLLGACPEYGCLVYEYMDYGSLEDRLLRRGNTPTLSWPIRFKIAAEITTALLFLHQTKPEPLVHRDLKPANILLDRNFVSKISDVGLARLVPQSNNETQYRMTAAAGTFCYIDPEYQQTGMLGVKSDIYSLGIMLLQIITAKSPMGLSHHVGRAIEKGTFAEMLDPTVTDWPMEEALSFAKLALKCAELRRKDRPDMATVILPELLRLKNLGEERSEATLEVAKAPDTITMTYSKEQRSHPGAVSGPWTPSDS